VALLFLRGSPLLAMDVVHLPARSIAEARRSLRVAQLDWIRMFVA